MKRILSLFLALVLCAGLLSLPGTAADRAPGDEITAADVELPPLPVDNPVEASISLSMENGQLKAAYTGTPGETALLIAAAYDGDGRMVDVNTHTCKSGESVSFPHDNTSIYRVYAVQPESYQPLCEPAAEINAFSGTVEVPYLDGAPAQALSMAVRRSAEARLLLDGLLELDPTEVYQNKEKLDAALAQVDAAIEAYRDLMQSSAVLYYAAEQTAEEQQKTAAAIARRIDDAASVNASQEEQRHWAEELTKKFDSIQGNMKLAALGKMLGCDAREAYEQLTAAQDILRGQYLAEAESASRWIKGLTVVKTSCKVALLVGGIAVTGGATTLAGAPAAIAGAKLTAVQTVGLLVGTTDAVIDVGKTGATLVFGDDHGLVKHLEDKSKPFGYISYTFALLTLNTASAPEIVTFLGDTYQNLKDAAPGTVNKVEKFILENDTLTMDVKTLINPLGTIGGLLEDMIVGPEDTAVTKEDSDRLETLRPEITDLLIAQTLKEAKVLEEEQTLEDFKEKEQEFEKEAAEELAEKKSEEKGSKLEYHEDVTTHAGSGVHRECYYTNADGKKVGLYEIYFNDVLTHRYCYDDDGDIMWFDGFHYPDGMLSNHEEYTDGRNPGSIHTECMYDFESESELKQSRQFLWRAYTDSNGQERTTFDPYYGTWLFYSGRGEAHHLTDVYTGSGGTWIKTESYDKEGRLTTQIELDEAGNYVQTDFYTVQPSDWSWFDPSTHAKSKLTAVPYFLEDDSRPFSYSDEITREEWKLRSWEEDITDGNGKKIGYTSHHGYYYYANTLVDSYNYTERIDVTEPVEVYYD